MVANSKIEWTHHTFSPWVGCTKVSRACDHCYAESWAKRAGHPDLWNGERRRTRPENWRQPLKWDKAAAAAGERHRVFCAPLADVFDNEVDPQWRADLFELIHATSSLDWLLLTKRIANAKHMLPDDWGDGYPNVWLGSTVVTQEEADRDVPKLLGTPARVHFLSIEPMLGPINLRAIRRNDRVRLDALTGKHFAQNIPTDPKAALQAGMDDMPLLREELPALDLVIAGGESGSKARPSHPDWFRTLRDQCKTASTAFFFKQWGEWAPGECNGGPPTRTERVARWWNGEWQHDSLTPSQSSEQHIDDEPTVYRLGKLVTGRLLDGREHNDMPESLSVREFPQ